MKFPINSKFVMFLVTFPLFIVFININKEKEKKLNNTKKTDANHYWNLCGGQYLDSNAAY